jgi:hypothetical protein
VIFCFATVPKNNGARQPWTETTDTVCQCLSSS